MQQYKVLIDYKTHLTKEIDRSDGAYKMRYRRIKRTGIYLSELVFGTWLHGSAGKEDKPGSPALISYEQGIQCLKIAVEEGINYFDTAPWIWWWSIRSSSW